MMSLYPIGTVVKLKGNDIEIVINGYKRKEPESGIVYDYIGVHAQYGMSLDSHIIFFNEDHIEYVIFEGYQDEDGDYDVFRNEFKTLFSGKKSVVLERVKEIPLPKETK